ncbi:MAG: hypothetical protein M1591_03120 [Deltaproteobacteria bacterium]|nr:hypothetical protein [Deltaproteobacteria bacterium]
MFGDFLVKQKIITNDQLTEAMNAQVIFGGRLGTNLIESGSLNEDDLEKYLAQYHHVSSVSMVTLNNIHTNALKLIPVKFVKKLKAIPFDYKDKQLYVIMMDPGRLDAIDELSFVTGMNIKPHAIPEIRFLLLLEKYYHIKRDIRYITLSKQDTAQFLSDRLNKKPVQPEQRPENKIAAQPQIQKGEDSPLKPLPPNEEFTTEEDFQDTVKAGASAAEPVRTTVELSHEMEVEEVLALKHPSNLQDAITLIMDSESRDDIASVVLGYALSIFKRAAIFMIQKGLAIGWEGAGDGVNRFNIKQLVIPLEQPSVFKFVNDTGAHFVGSPQPTELNKDFFLLLGGKPPRTVVIVPVHFMGRVVQMLYGDNGEGAFASTDIGELLILLQKVPGVIESLVLKKRRMS